MPKYSRGRIPRHLNAKRPDDVQPLTVEEARTALERAGNRNCLSWVDLRTDLAWCRLPGCIIHYEKKSRFKVNEHYDNVHLGARRARLLLCQLCDYQRISLEDHEVFHRRARYPCLLKCGRTWFSRKSGVEVSNHKKYCPLRKPPRGNLYGRTWIEAEKRFDKEVKRVKGDAPAQPVQADIFDFNAPLDQTQSPVAGSQQTDSREFLSHRSRTSHPTRADARESSTDSVHGPQSFVPPARAPFVPMTHAQHRTVNVPPLSSNNAHRAPSVFAQQQDYLYHPGQIASTFDNLGWMHDPVQASSPLHPHPFSRTPILADAGVYQHRSVAPSLQFRPEVRQPMSQNPVVFDPRTQRNLSYGDPHLDADYNSHAPASYSHTLGLYDHNASAFPQEYNQFESFDGLQPHELEPVPAVFDDRAEARYSGDGFPLHHPHRSHPVPSNDYRQTRVTTPVQSVSQFRQFEPLDGPFHHEASLGDFPIDPCLVWDYTEPTTASQQWNPQGWTN